MRGMIYKDLCLFFKGIDKIVLLVLGGLLVLFAAESGAYAGMLFSFALDMMVGVLHLTALEKEEKTAWRSYQRTMPVGVGKVMAGKYAAVLLTVPVSVAGAVVSNLASFAVYGTFLPEALELSVAAAVIVPPVFAMFSLPFYYWFGNQIAQFTSFPLAFLLFFAINPMASVIIGILSGRNIRASWFHPIVLSILFLFGTWILFDVREFIFYGVFYFILGCAAMLITSFIVRKRVG